MITGRVILVGAGPGDPGLLTVAGRAALQAAEVVLYDRLVDPGILRYIPATAEAIDVGKNKGCHPIPQDGINRLLVEHAKQGKRVVRLKGGDPYLFGRGAEEVEVLIQNNIPFTVIPGVTSAVAVPAYAGIPVTHRQVSSSLHIITGHGKDGRDPEIDYGRLAGLNGTLVFLMGLSAIGEICRGLIEAGLDHNTPAAVVENGTRPDQRKCLSTVKRLPDDAADLKQPAVIVIGRVCAMADSFDWFTRLPLHGKRILAVGSEGTSGRLVDGLAALGCRADPFHGITMIGEPMPDETAEAIGRFSWIVLTSRFGARHFLDELLRLRIDIRTLGTCKFAVVGRQTAAVLESAGIIPDCIPDQYDSPSLAAALTRRVMQGDRVLLYHAAAGSREVAEAMLSHGIPCTEVQAYTTCIHQDVVADISQAMRAGLYDAVAFTSASSVRAFANAMAGVAPSCRAFAIGPVTAEAAEALGIQATTCRNATIADMITCIVEELGG